MALTSLLYNVGNYIDTIELDVVITENASATSRITKNPVENGADINDHIIIEPMTFSMEGVVSNASSSILDLASGILNEDKALKTWNDLLKLMTDRTLFTLVQGLRSYNNVALLTLNTDADKDTSNGLFFTATFSEVIIVNVSVAPNRTYADQDTSDKIEPQVNGGLKQMTEVML